MKQHHFVILSGGEGTRLWPLATPEHPKQFLQWTESTTLFDETVIRIQPFLDAGAMLHVVTNKKYRHFFSQYENLITTFFEEDSSQNTAPAILYALQGVLSQDPEASVTFMPADHFIANKDLFIETTKLFLQTIEKSDALCTMGVKPTSASTEYGYIEAEEMQSMVKKVKRFYEKPDKERAQLFIENRSMFWNTGIYGAKVTVFLDLFEKYAPDLLSQMSLYKSGTIDYKDITKISFDCAVAEKASEMLVVESKYQWSDVGSLDVFLSLVPFFDYYIKKYVSGDEKAAQ